MNAKTRQYLIKVIALLLVLALMPSGFGSAQVISRPGIAVPFEGDLTSQTTSQSTMLLATVASFLNGDVFQNGADRLVQLQRFDGGWAWSLTDGSPAPSPVNTIAPIGQGLAKAYLHTSDPDHRISLTKAGALLLAKTNNFSPSDGYLAASLDSILGGTIYTDHVKNYFYSPLANGTYNRNGMGVLYTTETYVNRIRTARAGSQANLAAWDIGIGLVGAAAVGAETGPWINGTKAEINELNSNPFYDVIGLAGAVYGLAYVGEEYNPTAGLHAGAESLADLGKTLASYQLSTGGFTWNANYLVEGEYNESVQETAYAILALNELDRAAFLGDIQAAADYLKGAQLGTGGWEGYVGDPYGENNELTGEALWAIHTMYANVFSGFSQPIDTMATNIAKAGQTIPVKWRLTDPNGVPISDPSSFVKLYSSSAACDTGAPSDTIEEYAPGTSGLQYLGEGYWQFNWKTLKSYKGCRTMYVEFQGGLTSPTVIFNFK